MPEQPEARESRVATWTRGLDDGYTQAIEVVATIVLFFFVGRWLDGRFDTSPIFTIVLSVAALVGNVTKLYYGYRAKIEEASKGKPWAPKT